MASILGHWPPHFDYVSVWDSAWCWQNDTMAKSLRMRNWQAVSSVFVSCEWFGCSGVDITRSICHNLQSAWNVLWMWGQNHIVLTLDCNSSFSSELSAWKRLLLLVLKQFSHYLWVTSLQQQYIPIIYINNRSTCMRIHLHSTLTQKRGHRYQEHEEQSFPTDWPVLACSWHQHHQLHHYRLTVQLNYASSWQPWQDSASTCVYICVRV